MNENNVAPAPVVNLEATKMSIQIELQKKGFEKLKQQAEKVVVTEENLPSVAELLKSIRAFGVTIEAKHKELKAPHLAAGRVVDGARTEMLALLETIVRPIQSEYVNKCRDVEMRQIKIRQEQERVDGIKKSIEQNGLYLANEIANCDNLKSLITVETRINLQKGAKQNEAKFQEFLPDWVAKLNDLATLIKDQKGKIRQLDALNKKKAQAEKDQDENTALELHEEAESIQAQINENKINVHFHGKF